MIAAPPRRRLWVPAGRHFAGQGTSDKVDIGDVTACRFERLKQWSTLAFVRHDGQTTDEMCVVAKTPSTSGAWQLLVRLEKDHTVVVYAHHGGNLVARVSGTTALMASTSYLIALTNDGTGASGGLRLLVLDMAASSIDDLTGHHAEDASDLTGAITMGRTEANSDEFNGDLAYQCCVGLELSIRQIFDYLRDPWHVLQRYSSLVHYFLPLGHLIGTQERDYSRNQAHGTVSGTPGFTRGVGLPRIRRRRVIGKAPAAPAPVDPRREKYILGAGF